jgi:hypothetical protein
MLSQHQRFVCAPDNSEYVEITRQNRLKLASKLRILPRTCQSKTTAAIWHEIKSSEGEDNSDRNVSVIAEG